MYAFVSPFPSIFSEWKDTSDCFERNGNKQKSFAEESQRVDERRKLDNDNENKVS